MKQALLTIALFVASLAASAQTYSYITFRLTNGNEESISIDKLKITFADGKLNATSASGSTSIALADLSSFFFSETVTGIASAKVEEHAVSVEGGAVLVDGAPATNVRVRTAEGREVPATGLTKGIYLVTIGNVTYKVSAK